MFKRLAAAFTMLALYGCAAAAWPDAAIAQTINARDAVCDPKYPARCLKPNVDGSINISGGGGGATVTATAADPSYVEGSTANPLSVNLSGYLRTFLGAGSANIGTVNLGSLGGGSTAALQGVQGTGSSYDPPTGGSGEIGYLSGLLKAALDTTPVTVSLSQINGVTGLAGNGVTGTGSQRVTIASDNTAFGVLSTLQTQTDTVMVGGVNIKEINAVTPLMGNGVTGTGSQRVTVASDNTPFHVITDTTSVTQPVAGTTGGATPYGLQAAASTNSTNVKNSAGTLYGLNLLNTTTTIYYLRMYDASSAPTCSSATNFTRTWPIPPAAASGGAGGIAAHLPAMGVAFTTGLSFCVTGGPTSTDNTNAAVGVFINMDYK